MEIWFMECADVCRRFYDRQVLRMEEVKNEST